MTLSHKYFVGALIAVVLAFVALTSLTSVVHAQSCEGNGYSQTWGPGSTAFQEWLAAFGSSMYPGAEGCGYGGAGGDLDPRVLIGVVPEEITQGETAILAWHSENVTSCSIDQGIGSVAPGEVGSTPVSPPQSTTYTITCEQAFTGTTVSASAHLTVIPVAAPTASLSANPVSIVEGSSSTLTHSCTNSTSASINQGVGSVTPTSPPGATVSVSPSTNTTYTLTCTGAGGTATASVTVAVTPPSIVASCSVLPTNVIVGESATWTASASGGTGSYTYSWSGTDGLSGSSSSVAKTYSSAGTKTASVTVTSGSLSSTVPCNNSLTVTAEELPPPPPDPDPDDLSCTVSSQNVPVGGSVIYTASGASSPYTWTPSDGVGSYGSDSTANRTFTSTGPYGMTVSKSGYTSGNCPVVTVGTPDCGPASISEFSANPNRVRADNNDGTTLTYGATGVDSSCTISGPNISNTFVTPTPGACSISGTLDTPQITEQSVYRINCDNGEDTAEAVVNLIPRFIEF